jgi:hypothetical protein
MTVPPTSVVVNGFEVFESSKPHSHWGVARAQPQKPISISSILQANQFNECSKANGNSHSSNGYNSNGHSNGHSSNGYSTSNHSNGVHIDDTDSNKVSNQTLLPLSTSCQKVKPSNILSVPVKSPPITHLATLTNPMELLIPSPGDFLNENYDGNDDDDDDDDDDKDDNDDDDDDDDDFPIISLRIIACLK